MNALHRAFPRRHDFAKMVEELVARKMTMETMTQYFHVKLALSERCHFTGKEVVLHPGTPLGTAGECTCVQMPYHR